MEEKENTNSKCCNAQIMLIEDGGICIMCGTEQPVSEEILSQRHTSGEPVLLKEEFDSNPAI